MGQSIELTIQATFPPLTSVLPLFLTAVTATTKPILRPDDPFLVSYVTYHHFRSLGWVVKPGIKFAADWLLYRRGPVFSHSA
jgi:tRNA-splicing endonuclease subunit Sen2